MQVCLTHGSIYNHLLCANQFEALAFFSSSSLSSSPPLPPGHLNFWRLVCLYPLGKNFIQMLYQITRFDGQSFCKRWDQEPWLSRRPFLLSQVLAKVHALPINTSILKEETGVFCWKGLTLLVQILTPPRQDSNFPLPRQGKKSNWTGRGCLSIKVIGSLLLELEVQFVFDLWDRLLRPFYGIWNSVTNPLDTLQGYRKYLSNNYCLPSLFRRMRPKCLRFEILYILYNSHKAF